MGLLTFFKLEGSLLLKILKILCLISWSIGGCVYIYGIYEAIISTTTFPSGSFLVFAPWLLHVGLRFFVLWLPMGFMLIQWQMKRIVVPIVYLAGCFLAIVFSGLALILVSRYFDEDMLRKEYIELIKAEIKTGQFPPSVTKLIENHVCCSWFGPTDFAPKSLFDLDETRVNTDLPFMQGVQKCYGGVFTVTGSAGAVHYQARNDVKTEIPHGCAELLVDTANRVIAFTMITAIIVTILSLLIIIMYILNYRKIPSFQVGFVNTQSGLQTESQGFDSDRLDNEEPEGMGGVRDASSDISAHSAS